jgi:hypothetical protein
MHLVSFLHRGIFVTPCSLVVVNTYQTKRRRIPEYIYLHSPAPYKPHIKQIKLNYY